MRHRYLAVPLVSLVSLAVVLACSDSVAPSARQQDQSPTPVASGRQTAMTPAEYVTLLERTLAGFDERETDLLLLDATGSRSGQYTSLIARARQNKAVLTRMIARGRRLVASLDGGVPAAQCTDDGSPDECDDPPPDDGSGGGGEPRPLNDATHVVLNGRGGDPGSSIATSLAAVGATLLNQNHNIKVYQNSNLVFADSLQGVPPLIGTDPYTLERTYLSTIQYPVCGMAAGYSVHTFTAPPFENEVLTRSSVDDVCRTEEDAPDNPSGGGGGDNEPQGDLWCWFLSIYDGSGRLVSRTNTGNCWIM